MHLCLDIAFFSQVKDLFSRFNNTVDRNVSWYAHI